MGEQVRGADHQGSPVHLRTQSEVGAGALPADGPVPWCRAPLSYLYLHPTGEVRACPQSQTALGRIPRERLIDIWRGAVRRGQAEQMTSGLLPHGCRSCASEAAMEGRSAAYASTFDVLPVLPLEAWPSSMELNLSNACNLQCIQCNFELSSSIRAHQTDLPPLPKAYGAEFFTDLEQFLPHLTEIQFAGGEPFLAPENFRVWELIADRAPHVTCTVVTNATVWSPRVEAILERMPMNLVLSIDSIDPETYEAIRVGASFEQVRANIDRFLAYTRRAGSVLSINHCLMAQNVRGFGDLLLFAEEHEITVDVSVVRGPDHCSLTRMPADELGAVARLLQDQATRITPALVRNRDTWEREVGRIVRWAETADADRRRAYADTRYGHRLDFLAEAADPADPVDRDAVLAGLAAFAEGGPVHQVSVRREVIEWHTPGYEALLDLPEGSLLGRSPDSLSEQVIAVHGALVSEAAIVDEAGLQTITVQHERAAFRVVVVPGGDDALVLCIGIRLAPSEVAPPPG